MSEWIDVCPEAELAPNHHRVVMGSTHPIAVFNRAGTLVAIEDNCPHQDLPLSDGHIEDMSIECPFHGARFCLNSGAVLSPPACEAIKTHSVRVFEGMIQVSEMPTT